MRLVNAQEGGNATSVIVATPFDTFTASGIIASTVGQLGGATNQQAAATTVGGNSISRRRQPISRRRNQSAGPAASGTSETVEVRSPHTSWEETGT